MWKGETGTFQADLRQTFTGNLGQYLDTFHISFVYFLNFQRFQFDGYDLGNISSY